MRSLAHAKLEDRIQLPVSIREHQSFRDLPESLQAVLTLRFGSELTYSQMEPICDCSQRTIRRMVSDALSRLRESGFDFSSDLRMVQGRTYLGVTIVENGTVVTKTDRTLLLVAKRLQVSPEPKE